MTRETLTQQAADNLQQALKNVPGITLNAGEGGTHADNINLRGFAASEFAALSREAPIASFGPRRISTTR